MAPGAIAPPPPRYTTTSAAPSLHQYFDHEMKRYNSILEIFFRIMIKVFGAYKNNLVSILQVEMFHLENTNKNVEYLRHH